MSNYLLACDNANHQGDDTLCLFSLAEGDGWWVDSISYCRFSAIKDAIPVGKKILLIGEMEGRNRILGIVDESGCFEIGRYFVEIERPLALAVSEGGQIAVAHGSGVACLTLSGNQLRLEKNHVFPNRNVTCAGFLGEELVVAFNDRKHNHNALALVSDNIVLWQDSRERTLTKMLSWAGKLAIGDANNAELVVVGRGGEVDRLPLSRGFVKPLCVLEDGGLVVARNGWRRMTRRSGNLRRRDWNTLPAWAESSSYDQIIGADLVTLDASGAISKTTPISHLTTEAAALIPSGLPLNRPYTAANDRALRAQQQFEGQIIALRKALT